jgi:hypothetical protein
MNLEIINYKQNDLPKILKFIANILRKETWRKVGHDRIVLYKSKHNIYNPEYYFEI